MAVLRVYVEKKEAYRQEEKRLWNEINTVLGVKSVTALRIFKRYDVENIEPRVFETAKQIVFAEPQLDDIHASLPVSDGDCRIIAVEYLPGQFDQRAESCAQCLQLMAQCERPTVRTATLYLLYGAVSDAKMERVRKHLINPVESREASLDEFDTLHTAYEQPDTVETLNGFRSLDRGGLERFIAEYGLAMDLGDAELTRDYFIRENRDPTITEIRVLDTYWSDHCRHTTFNTHIDEIVIEDEQARTAYERYLDIRRELGRDDKPVTLMDLATVGARYLKYKNKLKDLDESEEINACSVRVTVDNDGTDEPWLLMFKNETHNHPTEIEPFGGAATCIGGAIRDPLSGRAYVYQAMRVTGAADPTVPYEATLKGKLPQRRLVTTAAAGYSSYGNQIGLATGLVDELYHPGFMAKRMEVGAVLGAAPTRNVRRERPAHKTGDQDGDVVVLLGGRTGRDGIGGATGSSKAHEQSSLETCGAEVQKGNAPEERKLQRLFRDPETARLIKRCNDFGAGGVSVAIGELAEGLVIDLDKVTRKYEGLTGTELAISESQERMAVVLAEKDLDKFLQKAAAENLEAAVVARATEEKRLKMLWKGNVIADIDRAFLDTNGAEKHANARITRQNTEYPMMVSGESLTERLKSLMSDLNVCSKRGLGQRFDSTIGASSVFMPYGGVYQKTPVQAMAAKLPVFGETTTCSGMAYGYDPFLSEQSPYHGAYAAVVQSVSRLIATGFTREKCWLTFQEYFERLMDKPERWGKPLAALLGALDAQLSLGIAAIGGKDSMSGSFQTQDMLLDVPPTLVSFAVSVQEIGKLISPEFKRAGSKVVLVDDLAVAEDFIQSGHTISAWSIGYGGIAEGLCKMAMGNRIGIEIDKQFTENRLFERKYGSFLLELSDGVSTNLTLVGVTAESYSIEINGTSIDLLAIEKAYESKLEAVFPTGESEKTVSTEDIENTETTESTNNTVSTEYTKETASPAIKTGAVKPRALISVFPGTNCEYDTARALARAGAEPEILVIRNLTPQDIYESILRMEQAIGRSQMLVIPGGFSGGDEPDGSAKLILSFFHNERVKAAVHELLKNRDGLMLGICNGFQALIKLGLLTCGEIREMDSDSPTLTFNEIGRHQSMLVRTRVVSNRSPWLCLHEPGDTHLIPISHGEGRFAASETTLRKLIENGQIATQYMDIDGKPAMNLPYNPNGSVCAIEGIVSPDGRVFGKMGHSERVTNGIYQNVPGDKFQKLFESGVSYFA